MSASENNSIATETLRHILETAQDIAHEQDVEGLCKVLLRSALKLTNADGGTLYLTQGSNNEETLKHTLFVNYNLGINQNLFAHESDIPPIPLYDEKNSPDLTRVASYTYHKSKIVSIDNITNNSLRDFKGSEEFDLQYNYTTRSILCAPICGQKQKKILGVFQLVNAKSHDNAPMPFSKEHEQAIRIFSDFASSALERQLIVDQQRNLLIELSSEPDTKSLIERVLRQAKVFSQADAGTLYLVKEIDGKKKLHFELLINDTLNLDYRSEELNNDYWTVPLFNQDQTPNLSHVASASVHTKKVISIEDAYTTTAYDFNGTKAFDREFDYRSKSILVIPLLNHDDVVIGALQLINASDSRSNKRIGFSNRSIEINKALARYAAIGLNNQLLVTELKALLDAFIQCIARAIDAKSSHTSAHCQRIPLLTEMIAQAACEDTTTFKDFTLNQDEWYELNVASWLHDCGKLATPDSVLEKATKLHLMTDRIEMVKTRFSLATQELEKELYKNLLNNPSKEIELKSKYNDEKQELKNDFDYIALCNKGGEHMSPEHQKRIKEIAKNTWTDIDGTEQPLLTNEEIHYLSIPKGTLTHEEREIINHHMTVTVDMLESLPFPEKLKRVPEYAAGHHEKMDGTGFPKGLKREQLSLPARMMAIADVFEALTASDRPYKEPMKISTALKIMNNMVRDQHLDPDIYKLFIESKVWEKYAQRELSPSQLDISSFSILDS